LRGTETAAGGEDAAGFFAPERVDPGRAPASRRELPLWRLAVRVGACVVALLVIDAAVARTLPLPAAYLDAYRLPRKMPTASLADYADAVETFASARAGLGAREGGGVSSTTADASAPVALFLGASPTWGHRVADPRYTFPSSFAGAAAADGYAVRAFNIACNGQLAGDQYLIAKRLGPSADVVFVQLTYHTFDRSARGGKVVRFPELPAILDVPLSSAEARLLRLDPAQVRGPEAFADRFLRRHWLLWRERDALDREFFGGRPQDVLGNAVAEWRGEAVTSDEDPPADGFADFDSLEPEQQMIVISQYAESSDFTLAASDAQVAVLAGIAEMLKSQGRRAVFFVSPLNMRLIREYGLIDPAQYAGNVAVLERAVAGAGFPFIDLNADPDALPRSAFADISHTTDAGARVVGALLWREAGAYVRGGPVAAGATAGEPTVTATPSVEGTTP
jgi:hypothetical protein